MTGRPTGILAVRVVQLAAGGVAGGDGAGIPGAEHAVIARILEVPEELLTHGAHLDGVGAGGIVVRLTGPEGEGEAEKQDGLNDHHANLDVGGGVTAHTVVVGLGGPAGAVFPEHIDKENGPADEQGQHEPMYEAEHVINEAAVLGGVGRGAEPGIDVRNAHVRGG
jgi:hypothetical protein